MSTALDTLSLACKEAEARHKTAYQLMAMLPAHDTKAPEWRPLWEKLEGLRVELDKAHADLLDALRADRQAKQQKAETERRAYTDRACPITPLDHFNAAAYEAQQRGLGHLQAA